MSWCESSRCSHCPLALAASGETKGLGLRDRKMVARDIVLPFGGIILKTAWFLPCENGEFRRRDA
jgi:hypothetical protein